MNCKLFSFSPSGDEFAHCGPDGILRVWNTSTGVLEHEFQPAEHLSATASCIRYSPKVKMKKKKKNDSLSEDDGTSLLAMGTVAGTILLYNPSEKRVVSTLQHSPSFAVVDLAWFTSGKLISLGKDKNIIEWDVKTGEKVMTVEVTGGNSLCTLLKRRAIVGNREIQLIAFLKERGVGVFKKKFTGHTTAVTQLLPVPSNDIEGSKYFLSTSEDDRFVYAWDVTSKSEEPVCSFGVKQGVASVAVKEMNSNTLALTVISRSGSLFNFSYHLNGNTLKKPVKSLGSLRLYCTDKGNASECTPIVSSTFCSDSEDSVIIAYGSSAVFKFERISLADVSGKLEIVRKDPLKEAQESTKASKEKELLQKCVTPKEADDATTIGPGHLQVSVKSTTKRKRGEDGTSSLPMEERLNALALDTPTSDSTTAPPKADNMTQLLLQGLHSKDARLLQSVFERGDENTVNNTVRRLPVLAVVPLLQHLQTMITGKGYKNLAYVRWVRACLYYHMSHLTTIPDREELMQPFYSMGAARMSTLPQVTQLHARLDLMLTHVTIRHQDLKKDAVEPEALLVYRDDSSDDEDLELPVGISESEDNWDELSDFGEVNGHSDDNSDMDVDEQLASVKRRLEEDEVAISDEEDSGENNLIIDVNESDSED